MMVRERKREDRCALWPVGVFLLAAVTGCLQWPSDPPGVQGRDALLEHVWTIVLTNDSDRVWVVQSDTTQGRPASLEDTLSATVWTALDGLPDQTNLRLLVMRCGGTIAWRLENLGAVVASGEGPLGSDALYLIPRSRGTGTLYLDGAVRSVAFDLLGGTPLPAQPVIDQVAPASDTVQAPAIVSLRVDDCTDSDGQSFGVLRQFGLTAEIGVPSRLLNRPGSCSVELVNSMVAAGNVVESHSRTHGATPSSFGDFYLETLGSLRDLRAWGYNPHVFIQPGSWNIGPCTFDNPAKLQSQYAGLVRRVYVAMEAYYPRTRTVAIPPPGRVGPAAYPIAGLAPATIDSMVRAAISSRGWVEFMWHSREMPPSSLTPRLAVIAALRDSGLVTVMPFYRALHATH